MVKYAELLNSYIENSGLTLNKLVDSCKEKNVTVHATYISKLRKGQRPAPSEEISKVLAEVTGHDPQELTNAGYLEKTPFPILRKVNQYEEIIESFKPALLQIISNDNFFNKISKSFGHHSSVHDIENMLNRLTATEQIKLLESAGCNFKIKKSENGKFNFWLEIDSLINETEHIINLPVYGKICTAIGKITLQECLGTMPWLVKNRDCKGAYMLKIKGDSMYPRFFPGDFAIVVPRNDVRSDDPAIVSVNDEEGFLKRVKKIPNGIILHSDNSLYEDQEFYGEQAKQVRIIGKVIDIKPGKI